MKGYLVLSTGETFEGEWIGTEADVYGEVVFFTGMTGYQEVITDPSFKGQIVVFTYPLIGNYGVNDIDNESLQPQVSGVIMSECNSSGFHYESKSSFQDNCQQSSIPMLTGVDTRAVVKRIRELGDMGAILTTDLSRVNFEQYEPIENLNLVKEVSTQEIVTYGEGDSHVVLLDFGFKKSIVDTLLKYDCKVTVVPYDTTYETIAGLKPDGILLSNGPGNPKQMATQLHDIKKLAMDYPTFGICLGHQLLALAFGADTEKLRFGHRGANQPVQDLYSKRVYMTSQNHSYVVKDASLQGTGLIARYKNINDGSVEGLIHTELPVASVQFHPEAHPGPSDSEEIFSVFITEMSSKRREKAYA
ncbi:carbamoyl phosphate synthase small subunit [Alkalihalobacterium chitinilyticum]|uniref:Carbamoyl phosphate synthase small chain n=1 Tax=Alkalihalobacterium chitinilyticum TaxID=2980103 RepID=A0ABT5VBR0_9BACI|nr:carbamoyl phosphate synthase small subunit [Alkalihalobacterium chitinilyticum]MDE5412591.1 carbamoyl phosphate synthase small subunit [Alkalihalobacterium chitinilyticum]